MSRIYIEDSTGEWILPLRSARENLAGRVARAEVTSEISLVCESGNYSSRESEEETFLNSHLHISDTEDLESRCVVEDDDDDDPKSNLRKDSDDRIQDALKTLNLNFDMTTWTMQLPDRMESLRASMKPCSHEHFMLLLFENPKTIVYIQNYLRDYLGMESPRQARRLDEISRSEMYECSDREILASELQMLRRLVAPIRPDAKSEANSSIHELDHQLDDDTESFLRGLHQSRRIIQEFENEIEYQDPGAEGRLSLNSPSGKARERSINLRLVRLDACQAAFLGVPYPVISPSDSGIRVRNTLTPADIPLDTMEVMTMVARWLARVRGAMAVDLFCDVAKLFSSRPPVVFTGNELFHVHLLSTIHPYEPSVGYNGDPWIGHAAERKNSTYFRDCEASQKAMMKIVCKGPRDLPEAEGLSPSTQIHGLHLTSHGGVIDGYHGVNRPDSSRELTSLDRTIAGTDTT